MKSQLAFAALLLSATGTPAQNVERASYYLISRTVVGTPAGSSSSRA